MTNIALGLKKDIEYYKMISGNNFIFDYEIYKKSFDEFTKRIIYIYMKKIIYLKS